MVVTLLNLVRLFYSRRDVPEIRKAIFNFQVKDANRKQQLDDISNIFYDNLNVEKFVSNEARAKSLHTNSFLSAMEVYLPATRKKTALLREKRWS